MLAPFHDFNLGAELLLCQLGAEPLHLLFSHGNNDLADLFVAREDTQRVNDDWRAVDLRKLLRRDALFSGRRHARPQSGRRDNYDDLHNGVRSITILPTVASRGFRNDHPLLGRASRTLRRLAVDTSRKHLFKGPLDALRPLLDDADLLGLLLQIWRVDDRLERVPDVMVHLRDHSHLAGKLFMPVALVDEHYSTRNQTN